MKLSTLLKTALKIETAGVLFCTLVSELLVNRNIQIPEKLSDLFSGADLSERRQKIVEYEAWLEDYGYERYKMISRDKTELVGYLLRPKKPSEVYVFCSHGYRCDGKREFCGISQYYINKGYNVFLVDHRAAGASGGRFIGFDFFESEDSLDWLYFMKESFGEDIKIILHGVSMGSATVMKMSGSKRLPENVKLIVADCGYTGAIEEFEYKLSSMHIPSKPLLAAVNAINKRLAGYDFKDTNVLDDLRKAKTPFLFIHGGADTFVPTHMVYYVFDACASDNKEMMIVDKADHASSFYTDREAYENKLDEVTGKFI